MNFVCGFYHADPVLYPWDRSHPQEVMKFEVLSEHPQGSDLIFHSSAVGVND
ncbi:bacteriocin immunity protein [Pseudomonas fulva]|uniref:bacteriocin immunity protein n=1 Tax=Pseudomonas fulva TaxID=47880 RepID=UPI003C7DD5CD